MILTALRRLWPRPFFRYGAAAGAVAVLLAGGAWWYAAAEDRVCLVEDGRATLHETRAPRVREFLASVGLELAPEDAVDPGLETAISEGMTINVRRAFPVKLVIGGEPRIVRTVARPVADLLRSCRVDLDADDRVVPSLAQEIKPGGMVRVIRVETREITYRQEIPPQVVTSKDGNLDQGVRRVVKGGAPGLVERTARLRLEDGAERDRQVISTRWLRRPETRVVAVGTRPVVRTFVTSRGKTVRYTKKLRMTATAYYPGPESCGPNAKGITRTGARATYGVVAVDPRVIPLGTRLYVEGYGFATALDTGSAIKGAKIDLCFDTYREAYMYGKRSIDVYILAE
ncbi:MAG: 3D domain-containing protein [Bacteroidota bacterium]